jgi:hypothetical protein
MVLVSFLVFALRLTSSASAALTRACSVPFDRKASARSLLSCAFPSLGVEALAGSFGEGSEVAALTAFSASREAVRSRSVVSRSGQSLEDMSEENAHKLQ